MDDVPPTPLLILAFLRTPAPDPAAPILDTASSFLFLSRTILSRVVVSVGVGETSLAFGRVDDPFVSFDGGDEFGTGLLFLTPRSGVRLGEALEGSFSPELGDDGASFLYLRKILRRYSSSGVMRSSGSSAAARDAARTFDALCAVVSIESTFVELRVPVPCRMTLLLWGVTAARCHFIEETMRVDHVLSRSSVLDSVPTNGVWP